MARTVTRKSQAGITLIEALVSLLILALGILGLAAVQARMLVEARVTNSRATAVRLITDLGERMRANAAGVNVTPPAPNPYLLPAFTGAPGAVAANCTIGVPCAPALVAQDDINTWLNALGAALPGGQAQIVQTGTEPRVRVIVAWRINEREGVPLADQLRIAFGGGGGDECPADSLCHLDFIEIPSVTYFRP